MDLEHAVFEGLDVGKREHDATAVDPSSRRLHDGTLPNDETRLRQLFDRLAEHGPVLVVVDQAASIGALPLAVARAVGARVAYLPGLARCRLADLPPDAAKTDAGTPTSSPTRPGSLPHTLRQVGSGDAALAELEVLVGFDDDLTAAAARPSKQLRGLLTRIDSALKRVLAPSMHHPAVLEMPIHFGESAGCARQDGADCSPWPAASPPAHGRATRRRPARRNRRTKRDRAGH